MPEQEPIVPIIVTTASSRPKVSVERLRTIVNVATHALFEQTRGGRIVCESEATLQLHLGRIIAAVADLHPLTPRETFSIELERPLRDGRGKRGGSTYGSGSPPTPGRPCGARLS